MSRFANWRARRRSDSRPMAPGGPWPPGSNKAVPQARLAPDAGSHLSDGVVVHTHLVARLLGVRILKVDGVVQVAPARLERPVGAAPTARVSTAAPPAPGGGLARAAGLLEDGDRRLR